MWYSHNSFTKLNKKLYNNEIIKCNNVNIKKNLYITYISFRWNDKMNETTSRSLLIERKNGKYCHSECEKHWISAVMILLVHLKAKANWVVNFQKEHMKMRCKYKQNRIKKKKTKQNKNYRILKKTWRCIKSSAYFVSNNFGVAVFMFLFHKS